MEPGSTSPEVARLLERLAHLTEQLPDEDDPALVLSYVPRFPLVPGEQWQVNLNLGPVVDDIWVATSGGAAQVLRQAIEMLEWRQVGK